MALPVPVPPGGASLRAAWCAAALLFAAGLALHLAGLDLPVMAWLHQGAPSLATQYAWSSFTVLGLGWAVIVLVLAADRGRGWIAADAPLLVLACGLAAQLPKHLFHNARPAVSALAPALHVIGEPVGGNASFPSGHALAAVAGAALLWRRLPPETARRWSPALLAFAILVPLSRVMVGAHWPGDVLAGAGLGLATALLLTGGPRSDPERPGRERWLAALRSPAGQYGLAAFELVAALAVAIPATGYPLGWPAVVLLCVVALISAAFRIRRQLGRRAATAAAANASGPP